MKRWLSLVFSVMLLLGTCFVHAQQRVAIVSRCGGLDTVTIPNIVDRDSDGMDDALEQKLLNRFMPAVMMFSNENCPGPALDGTGDTNLIVARISPYPGQYVLSSSLDSLKVHPAAVVPAHGLHAGLLWYNTFVMVHCAVLYGQDCGALGHQADVEGFHFSLRYIGPDTLAGWMYDTTMANWMGATIQSVAHDGTLCQHIETLPYKSALVPTGCDSVYASPNKHGNYLTVGDCNSALICNPGCNATQIRKIVTNVNVGEPWATLVPDLGSYYPAYAGNNPWGTTNFLSGGAGTIADKMERPLSSDFAAGQTLTSQQICPIYATCWQTGSALLGYVCSPNTYGFYSQQLSSPGVYTHHLTDQYGCDSTITLTLAVYNPSAYSYNDSTCNGAAYNFHGQMLSANGTYFDTLTNANGCDSVVTLNLVVNPLITSALTDSFCVGATYTFNGQQYNAPGVYYDTLVSARGCDSIVSLNLSNAQPPTVSWNVNVDTLPQYGNAVLLTGATPTGGTYSGTGVSGNYFYPDSAGVGTHVVTYTYTDTMGCGNTATNTFVVIAAGIEQVALAAKISVFPNPASEQLIIESVLFNTASMPTPLVCDVTGKICPVPATFESNRLVLNTSALADGFYNLRLSINGQSISKQFVKQK